MQAQTYPPGAREVMHLRPSDTRGAAIVLGASALTALSLALSARPELALWLVGQVLLAAALVHWFVLLHEAGHRTLFQTRRAHAVVGRLASMSTLRKC